MVSNFQKGEKDYGLKEDSLPGHLNFQKFVEDVETIPHRCLHSTYMNT